MTEDPETIALGKAMRTAITMLARGKMRHLPVVVDDGRLVGVVSRTDLLAAMPSTLDPSVSPAGRDGFLAFKPIEEIVRREVVTVHPDADIAEAARLMCEHRINCLPVCLAGKLIGIITSFDLLQAVVHESPGCSGNLRT